MILLKDESVKILNEFALKNRSAVMNLLTHCYSIPEYDADDILQDAWLLLLEKLTVGELPDVPSKLSAYLTKVCSLKAHEYFRRRQSDVTNISFDDDANTPEQLNAYEMEAQSWDDFIKASKQERARRHYLVTRELEKLTEGERRLLMEFFQLDGSKTSKASMKELAQRLGYRSDRVAITLKSRIMKKLRTGIQQQERALGNGLSPVAFFMGPLFAQSESKCISSIKNNLNLYHLSLNSSKHHLALDSVISNVAVTIRQQQTLSARRW